MASPEDVNFYVHAYNLEVMAQQIYTVKEISKKNDIIPIRIDCFSVDSIVRESRG